MIVLPFPSSALSGHANGSWYMKRALVKQHRALAREEAELARPVFDPSVWDIRIHFRFVPPSKRGDRTNFPNRLKPYIDGIADAMGINDRRFLPSYEFCAPEKPGRVEVFFPGNEAVDNAPNGCGCDCDTVGIERPATSLVTTRGADQETCSGGSNGS